jgi:tetratricopeptide (TPR) repeat protein
MLSDAPGTSYRTSAERMKARLMPIELVRVEESTGKFKAAVEAVGAVDGYDDDQDAEWQTTFATRRSAMEQVNIRLEHGLLSQYIEKQEREKGAIDLTKGQMRCQVLLNCLDIITRPPNSASEEDLNAALQYCAVFLPEHVINTLPADGDPEIHLRIVQGLVRLFRNKTAIDRWIETAQSYMTADLLNNNEFLDAVKFWLDAETVSKLDHDEKAWVEEALAEPVQRFFHLIARRHANMWLTQRLVIDDNFEFINTYLHKLDKPTGNTTVTNESISSTVGGEESTDQGASGKGPAKPDAEDTATFIDSIKVNVEDTVTPVGSIKATLAPLEGSSDYTLGAASADRVIEVAQWADTEENAMWYARVGYALRMAGDGARSVEHFEKSLEMDPSDGVTRAGLARTYDVLDDPINAIKIMEEAVANLIARASAPDMTAKEREEADADVAEHREDLALYYYQAKKRDQAVRCYDDLLRSWEHQIPEGRVWDTTIYNANAYLQNLADWKVWDSAADLLERVMQHPRAKTKDFLDIYRFFLYGNTTLLMVSYHSKRFSLADDFYADAVQCLAEHGNDGETAMMRYNRAFAMLRLQPARSEAVNLLRRTSGDSEFLDADNGFSVWLGRVKVELARKYMDNILCAREKPRWQDVGTWAHKLVALLRDTDEADDTDAAAATSKQPFVLTLAAWDRISGRQKHARLHVKEMLTDGVDMLSDDDESNDYWAWSLLNNATLAVGDFGRAATAIHMLRLLSAAMDPNLPTTTNNDHDQAVEGTQNTDATAEVSVLPLRVESHESPNALSNGTSVEINTPGDAEHGDAVSKATEPADTYDAVPPGLQPVITAVSSWYNCDGPCGEDIPDTSTIWRCSYCIAEFCAGCHDLIMNRKNKNWGFCNATHEHVGFEGVTVKWPKDMVKPEGEFVPVRQWLDELMKDYGIEKKVSAVAVAEEKRDVDEKATEGGAEEKEEEPRDGAEQEKRP